MSRRYDSQSNFREGVEMRVFLRIGLTLAGLALAQTRLAAAPGSPVVNGYPTLDANRVYVAGQQVKVDEPHGVYTGLLVMDDYYFLNPLIVSEAERKSEGGTAFAVRGSLLVEVRHAINSAWDKAAFSYDCENREFRMDRTELARMSERKEFIVGDHGAVCVLKSLPDSDAKALLNTHVAVEPWQTLVRDTVSVNAGRAPSI
jgi:hypothetical protein